MRYFRLPHGASIHPLQRNKTLVAQCQSWVPKRRRPIAGLTRRRTCGRRRSRRLEKLPLAHRQAWVLRRTAARQQLQAKPTTGCGTHRTRPTAQAMEPGSPLGCCSRTWRLKLTVRHCARCVFSTVLFNISICIWIMASPCASTIRVKRPAKLNRRSTIAFSATRQFVPSRRAKAKSRTFSSIWAFRRDLKATAAMAMERRAQPAQTRQHGARRANKGQHALVLTRHGDHLIGQQLIQVCKLFQVRYFLISFLCLIVAINW